jgi:hypothetical protein
VTISLFARGTSQVSDAGAPRHPALRATMNPQDRSHTVPLDGPDRRATDSAATREALVDALARCRSELEARVPDVITGEFSIGALDTLRQPIAEFAVVACREKLPPERALVMFKRMIGQLADVERCPIDQRETVHRQLVEMAIESYFSDQARPTAG